MANKICHSCFVLYNENMTQRLRGFIFWSMVFLFFLCVPVVLFYALNYSYDWQNKKLVQNGAFYLKSSPKNAQIFINGKYKKNTPRLIEKLPPRNYLVEIKKDGFYPWKKELTIESGLVTETSHILLIKTNPVVETIEGNSNLMENFSPLPTGQAGQKASNGKKNRLEKLIADYRQSNPSLKQNFENYQIVYSTNSVAAVLTYSTTTSADQKIEQKGRLYLIDSEENFVFLADSVANAEFSSDNKKLLWQTDNEIWVYWLEDDYIQPYKKTGDKELITRFSGKIKQAIWYKEDDEHIIFVINDTIKIIEIDGRDQKNITDILTIKSPQILSKNKILYILSENKLYKTAIEENSLF